MIVSVTANTALDHTLFVDSLRPYKTNRARTSIFSMAGKPVDASWVLSEMGIPSLALGFAAGNIGHQMEDMLRERMIQTDFVWVEGETRINTVIVQEGDQPQTTITTNTLIVHPHHIQELQNKYTQALQQATCIILGGSLPNQVPVELYRDFTAQARAREVPVALDATGTALRAGLQGNPSVIKPNQDELQDLVGHPVKTREEIYQAACRVAEEHNTAVVASLGGEGALAVLRERAYWIPPLEVPVASPAGAGDAVTAGMAFALAKNLPLEEGLRFGIAAAAAVVMLPGTADCRREDIERFIPQVQLIPYPGRCR